VSFSIESRTVTRVPCTLANLRSIDRVDRVNDPGSIGSIGPRRGENVGRSRRERRATEREPADGSRDLMSMGASPSERNHRFARAARARSRRERRRAVLRNATIAALVAVLVFLKMFYPGDQTLRSLSESWMRLMFSRRGISFGKVYEARFEGSVRLEAGDGAIEVTKREYTVQGKIPDKPKWRDDLKLENLVDKEKRGRRKCYFYVHVDEPVLVLHDDGQDLVYNLESAKEELDLEQFRCRYFKGVMEPESGGSITSREWELLEESESGGKVALMSSATTLGMLSAYHKTLANHQAYAKDHGYTSILALIPKSMLAGRSGKFAKHIAMGVQTTRGMYDMVCHVDLDAWFASWDPLGWYSRHWPKEKSLFFGDTGQVWLNTGLMCARSNDWVTGMFERVVNAVYEVGVDEGGNTVKYGFKRDQPAMWHVLASEWATDPSNPVPYFGSKCKLWSECNPDANPIECWHSCFWDALQRVPRGWNGLHDVNKLSNVFLDSQHNTPKMHRMCLASCHSVLSRANMEACSMSGRSDCFPKDVDKMSLCDGEGCLRQLSSGGGAWLKHTGHQHWRDNLPTCIPLTKADAMKERKSYLSLCKRTTRY